MSTTGSAPQDPSSRVSPSRFTRLGRYSVASIVALQLIVAVLAGGSVIGAFMVPGGTPAATAKNDDPSLDLQTQLSAGAPMEISMPTLKVKAPVVPIAMIDGALDPPRDYLEVGWWNGSAKPGATEGQTVITGHTLHTGGASMNNLGELGAGDPVDVITKRGTMRYRVTATKVYTKAQLSKHSEELFSQARGTGRLILITCSNWNGSFYETNTVVTGRPQGAPPGATPIPAISG